MQISSHTLAAAYGPRLCVSVVTVAICLQVPSSSLKKETLPASSPALSPTPPVPSSPAPTLLQPTPRQASRAPRSAIRRAVRDTPAAYRHLRYHGYLDRLWHLSATRHSSGLDSDSVVNARLKIGSSPQTVSVTADADASILNTENFDVTGGLNSVAVENTPITSRNTFNLALFAPCLNGTRDDEFGNPTFAFGGMQRKDFMIDGVDNTQRGGPGHLGIFSPESVKEIKVVSGAMDAEYGRTVGGVINMITNGGSNSFRGEFVLLERRPGLIARPSLFQPTPFRPQALPAVGHVFAEHRWPYYPQQTLLLPQR